MGRIAWEIHRFCKEHHRRDSYIREDRWPLHKRRWIGNDVDQTTGWMGAD